MDKRLQKTLRWAPRIVTILFILFISMFALDVFAEYSFPLVLVALFMHLIPSFILIIALIVAWRWPLAGGIIFIIAGIAAFFFFSRGEWMSFFIITLPAFIIGALFLLEHFLTTKKNRK